MDEFIYSIYFFSETRSSDGKIILKNIQYTYIATNPCYFITEHKISFQTDKVSIFSSSFGGAHSLLS